MKFVQYFFVLILIPQTINASLVSDIKDQIVAAEQVKNFDELMQLLENQPIRDQNDYIMIAFRIAAEHNKTNLVQYLLAKNINPNIKSFKNSTPLMFAAHYGAEDVVNLLLQHHAYLDLINKEAMTALIFAARNGHEKVVQNLLQHGANPNLADRHDQTALMYASSKGYKKIAQLFLQAGAPHDLKSKGRCTALSVAILHNKLEVIKELFRRHPDIDDTQEPEAFICALGADAYEAARALIRAEFNIDLASMALHQQNTFSKEFDYVQNLVKGVSRRWNFPAYNNPLTLRELIWKSAYEDYLKGKPSKLFLLFLDTKTFQEAKRFFAPSFIEQVIDSISKSITNGSIATLFMCIFQCR